MLRTESASSPKSWRWCREPGSLGPLDRAKNAAVDAAARTVIGLARHFVPEAIEQLEPGFQEHAEAYRTAVANLPDVITADRLLAAGPAAVESYRAAQQEAGYLD